MSRLPRFERYRFVGTRDTMIVYDCDDDDQFAELAEREESEKLGGRLFLQSFAPDTITEARNRGFRPVAAGRLLPVAGQDESESDL